MGTSCIGLAVQPVLWTYSTANAAVVYNIFVKPKKIEFKLKDVEVPEIPGPFCTFKANSVPLFVEGSQFSDIRHYGKIMGYDKPVDLMWDHELDMTKSAAEAHRRKNKEG